MDITLIKEALSAVGMVLSILRQTKEVLPEGEEKEEATQALKQAEIKLRLAEAQIAQGLGYELCKNHYPPEIMLSQNDDLWRCPQCGNERERGILPAM